MRKAKFSAATKGKKRGRPRRARFDEIDGIEDLPLKRDTRPGRTTLQIVQRVKLAQRYLRRHASVAEAASAYLEGHFPDRGGLKGQTQRNLDRVERWLRDPARSAPPMPENARKKRRVSLKSGAPAKS